MSLDQTFTILAVDDEPGGLSFLSQCLKTVDRWNIIVASDGPSALRLIAEHGAPAVIVADMHMPGMDGTTLLASVQAAHPDTVRMLLTGQANLDSAIEAVNVGQIFRFLTKPCQPAVLRAAVGAAVDRYKVVVAERVLLEETLQGTIKTLVDALSMTNSVSFGRAMRIRRHVTELTRKLSLTAHWQIEVAAMLSQLGFLTLPADITEKVYNDRPLSREEASVVSRLPAVTEQLLAHIPRLEVVRAILAHYETTAGLDPAALDAALTADERQVVLQGAQLLRVASDFDALDARGGAPAATIAAMRSRAQHYAPEILDAIGELNAQSRRTQIVKELPLREVQVGMVLADDLLTRAGSLMVVRGYEFTKAFVERCRSYPQGWLKEPIRVLVSA